MLESGVYFSEFSKRPLKKYLVPNQMELLMQESSVPSSIIKESKQDLLTMQFT